MFTLPSCTERLHDIMFYRSPYGIRFEVEDDVFRAQTLFHDCTHPDDEVYLVNFNDVGENTLEHYVSSYQETDVEKIFPYRYQFEPNLQTIRCSIKRKAHDIQSDRLFQDITDACAGGDYYIVNRTKHLIFHLYDHRGLDIIANQKESLRSLYVEYQDWILGHDRPVIDALFSGFTLTKQPSSLRQAIVTAATTNRILLKPWSAPATEHLRQQLADQYANGRNHYPLWHHLEHAPSVQNADAWRWLQSWIGNTTAILLFNPSHEPQAIEITGGREIVTLLGELPEVEFYLTNPTHDYLLCFNDHDHLIACGTAKEW